MAWALPASDVGLITRTESYKAVKEIVNGQQLLKAQEPSGFYLLPFHFLYDTLNTTRAIKVLLNEA
jgi:hypothetical protein